MPIGDRDSSPSRADDHDRATEQHHKTSQSHALWDSSASGTSSGALASNAASALQPADMPNPGMQSPQQPATGSAFSAFTSPAAKSAGQVNSWLCCCCNKTSFMPLGKHLCTLYRFIVFPAWAQLLRTLSVERHSSCGAYIVAGISVSLASGRADRSP